MNAFKLRFPSMANSVTSFLSEDDANDYMTSDDYADVTRTLDALIVVYQSGRNVQGQRGWEYRIRMNASGLFIFIFIIIIIIIIIIHSFIH